MTTDRGYGIVWLDAHIGDKESCLKMKKEFGANLAQVGAVPPVPYDPINDLICVVSEYCAPISFTDKVDGALKQIEEISLLKKVILISSATLGRQIYPEIVNKQLQIQSYYVFCANIEAHADFGNDCINNGLDTQMFDHEKTLLIRLGRDMSKILIEDGKTLLNTGQPELALTYFQYAYALADKAFEHDTPVDEDDKHRPSTEYRRILDDLIDKAKKA